MKFLFQKKVTAANPLMSKLQLNKHCQDDPKRCNEGLLASTIENSDNTKESEKTGGPGGSSPEDPEDEEQGKAVTSPYNLESTHKLTMGKKRFKKFVNQVKADGKIKEPIKYVEHNGKRYIVDGHHRVSAAKEAGLKKVPIEKVKLPYKGYKSIDDLFN